MSRCTSGTTTNHTYNSFSQLTNTGYVYDALGRNTSIPSVDTPNQTGAITLAYNTNDQVTLISQAGVSTSYGYDVEGRRLNESTGGVTTTKHYTDSSDNPAWSVQTGAGAPAKTEIYLPSLGSGLNVVTTTQNNVKTVSMQLHDLRGNTVTTIDLDTDTATAWSSYDEYGNPVTTNPTNTNNINYSTYGQAERATTITGLILMGARVYNAITNQFLGQDPIRAGNENAYTSPTDSINSTDFTGSICDPGSVNTGAHVSGAFEFCPKPVVPSQARTFNKIFFKQLSTFGTTSWKKQKFEQKPTALGVASENLASFRVDRRFSTLNIASSHYSWERNLVWLKRAMASGRPIVLTDNPYPAWGKGNLGGKTYSKELGVLRKNGHTFLRVGGGLWIARR